MKGQISLRGVSDHCRGKTWNASRLLRVGRADTLEIVLEDNSVSRNHAEIVPTDQGWRLKDLGSTNGTRLNGVRLGSHPWPLRNRDLIQFGEVALVVEAAEWKDAGDDSSPDALRVEATTRSSWEEALQGVIYDSNRCPRPGEQLLALLRAGQHLVGLDKEDDLFQNMLADAVSVLDAQRAAIVLPEGLDGQLRLRSLATGRGQPKAQFSGQGSGSIRPCFSHSLARRCFEGGESDLCQHASDDPELSKARSIADGSIASVICVLLRTPRRKIGVLHLDRSPWQKPFTLEEMHLADALAAQISAGVDGAQLFSKQRDLFLNTITVLAQTVELKDPYTGGHTARVTSYSMLLAHKLNLSAEDLDLVRMGTPLHDIGKIGIADAILGKPDRLTPQEFEAMKQHTVFGAQILSALPDLAAIIPIVRSHHERWDGKGYPDALAAEAIHPLARLVAVADAFDAMTSDRPYRKVMSADVAFQEISAQSGKQFDPRCAAAFLEIKDQVVVEMERKEQTTTLNEVIRRERFK